MLSTNVKEKMNILLIEFNEILGSFRIQYELIVSLLKKYSLNNTEEILYNFIKHFLRPYLNIFLVKLMDLKNEGKITEVWIFTDSKDHTKSPGYISDIVKNIEQITNTDGLFDNIEIGLETKLLRNYFPLDEYGIILVDSHNKYQNNSNNIVITLPYLVMYSPTTLVQFLRIHLSDERILNNIYIQLIHKYRQDTTYRSSLIKYINKQYLAKCFSRLTQTSITYFPKHDDDTLINLIDIIDKKF